MSMRAGGQIGSALHQLSARNWVNMRHASVRTNRERFIFRAAHRHGLTSSLGSIGQNKLDRVEKQFWTAMHTCPLPEGAQDWNYQPKPEDYFAHLAACRLAGLPLPLSLESFAP